MGPSRASLPINRYRAIGRFRLCRAIFLALRPCIRRAPCRGIRWEPSRKIPLVLRRSIRVVAVCRESIVQRLKVECPCVLRDSEFEHYGRDAVDSDAHERLYGGDDAPPVAVWRISSSGPTWISTSAAWSYAAMNVGHRPAGQPGAPSCVGPARAANGGCGHLGSKGLGSRSRSWQACAIRVRWARISGGQRRMSERNRASSRAKRAREASS